ncbi:tetratricopeptide repeat protein [Flavobacterium endophyticum]|uniref:Tetratricopeptide repeat protein n=1 Tax=Flavobacterium endophyticum TaxID=1540163 RepID=A0A495MLT3_9FLAO|nr:tetratricopeptide repeat protein [Flavobacterium endophyticum]RKS26002.1 tetratricopeptide repeat protein [Flavobacterium endophyticum]
MKIRKIYALLFFLLIMQSYGQEKKYVVSDFDNAYLQEIKAENSELSARIKTFPQEIQDLNKKVAQAIRNNDDAKALELAIEMDKKFPKNADIKNFIGKLQAKALKYDEALVFFDEALLINPDNKWFYINKATALAENNKSQEAMKTIEKLNSKFPNWSIGYNFKASLFRDMNQQNEALKAYDLAIISEPKSAQIFTNRGDFLLELSKEEQAIADYKKALEIQPDYARAQEKLKSISKTVSEKK